MLLDIALDRCGVALHYGEALRQLLQVFEAARPLRLAAERLAQRRRKLDGLSGLEADQRDPRCALFQADFHSIGGMRIDHYAELVINLLNRAQSIGVRAPAGNEFAARARQLEFPLGVEPAVEVPDARAVAADKVEHVALEVRCLRDVHGRTGGLDGLFSHLVATGAEEFVEYVVLVAGEDQAPDGQAHAARDVTGIDVAEIAGRHCKRDFLIILFGSRKVALEVVNDLRGHPRPVDRIHRADAVLRLEGAVGVDLLDQVLAVVEGAFPREVVNVRVLQRVHLRALERAHAAVRGQHEHLNAALAAQRVLRRGAGVAGCRAEYVQSRISLLQDLLKQVAEKLQRDVLEGERRPVRQAEQMKARLERLQRRDVVTSKNFLRVSGFDDPLQIGKVIHELRQDGMSEPAETLSPQRGEIGPRIILRDIEPAVRGEALQQDVGKAARRRVAAGRDVEHYSSSSRRILVTFPTTVESFSIFAIAWLTFFSSARWVSMTMSTRLSPLPGSFCTMASIEIFEPARMRVMSASTPGWSSTRMRR